MLTETQARNLKTSGKTVAVGGVPGLSLKPGAQKGAGKYTLRFVSPTTQKRRDMGMGTYPEIGLAQARRLALEARELIAMGVDPIEDRKRLKAEEASSTGPTSFEAAAHRVFADIAPAFRNKKHRDQWINTLTTYVFPYIGAADVDQLTTADFARCLMPIWLDKPETASRVKQRCDRVMTWCLANELTATNPVPSVSALLPKQVGKADRVTHHPAVLWRDLPDVAENLFEGSTSIGRQALQFLILTAARSGEVRNATWQEFDLEQKIWDIPPERMKARRAHRVPLSAIALDLLRHRSEMNSGGQLVFTTRPDRPLSDMTLSKILRDHAIPSDTSGRVATVHGFRSSFRDWASENGYARDLAERALAHTIKNATEAAYHRTDQLEQRRGMMEAWGAFVMSRMGSEARNT